MGSGGRGDIVLCLPPAAGPNLDTMTVPRRPSGTRKSRTALVLALAAATVAAAACSSGSGGSSSPTTAVPSVTTAPASVATTAPPASAAALATVLGRAYQTETAALATYRNVVASLGPVGPFPNIITAEQQHVATVTALMSGHRIALPAAGAGQAAPSTLGAACRLGVTVEQQVISLYGELLPQVTGYPDVTTAFKNLQAASRDSHLPAFEHCA